MNENEYEYDNDDEEYTYEEDAEYGDDGGDYMEDDNSNINIKQNELSNGNNFSKSSRLSKSPSEKGSDNKLSVPNDSYIILGKF